MTRLPKFMAKDTENKILTSRKSNQIREIEVKLDFTPNALASVLYKQGDTIVLVSVTKADSLPRWFPRNSQKGWINAEYSLLPGSTNSRFRRERNGAKGRTMEIERLIARSLRGVIDLEELGPISITVDCDILNADGGTRCASITAANIGLRLAVRRLISSGDCIPKKYRKLKDDTSNSLTSPSLTDDEKKYHELAVMKNDVAAISVGLFGDDIKLDLDYILDSNADVDMNIVGTSDGMLVEVQGTGEEATFSRTQLDKLMDYADIGLEKLHEIQSKCLD